eukprot:scaffold43990_cov244-Amphora_coffeaeformis.AAC.1
MESFRYSYYPISTHRAGKRVLPEQQQAQQQAQQSELDSTGHDNGHTAEQPPPHKRLKQGTSPEWTTHKSTAVVRSMHANGSRSQDNISVMVPAAVDIIPPQTPSLKKRDFETAGLASLSSSSSSSSSSPTTTTATTTTRRRLEHEQQMRSQSAGQITTESPERGATMIAAATTATTATIPTIRKPPLAVPKSPVVDNSWLGRLHAERLQRHAQQQQHQQPPAVSQNVPLLCPLTSGMHAMSIGHPSYTRQDEHYRVQLRTNSKLG